MFPARAYICTTLRKAQLKRFAIVRFGRNAVAIGFHVIDVGMQRAQVVATVVKGYVVKIVVKSVLAGGLKIIISVMVL